MEPTNTPPGFKYYTPFEPVVYEFPRMHRMKPFRGTLTHALLNHSFPLPSSMRLTPTLATRTDLGQLHGDQYISLLQVVSRVLEQEELKVVNYDKETSEEYLLLKDMLTKFNLGQNGNDCFAGLFECCRVLCSGTMG